MTKLNKVKVTWPILGISALHLTHPKCTHTAVNTHTHCEHTPGAVGSHLCCGARGAVGGSVPCSRAPQSWYWGGESAGYSHPPQPPNHPTTQPPNHPTTQPTNQPTNQPTIPAGHETRTRGLWITSPTL